MRAAVRGPAVLLPLRQELQRVGHAAPCGALGAVGARGLEAQKDVDDGAVGGVDDREAGEGGAELGLLQGGEVEAAAGDLALGRGVEEGAPPREIRHLAVDDAEGLSGHVEWGALEGGGEQVVDSLNVEWPLGGDQGLPEMVIGQGILQQ